MQKKIANSRLYEQTCWALNNHDLKFDGDCLRKVRFLPQLAVNGGNRPPRNMWAMSGARARSTSAARLYTRFLAWRCRNLDNVCGGGGGGAQRSVSERASERARARLFSTVSKSIAERSSGPRHAFDAGRRLRRLRRWRARSFCIIEIRVCPNAAAVSRVRRSIHAQIGAKKAEAAAARVAKRRVASVLIGAFCCFFFCSSSFLSPLNAWRRACADNAASERAIEQAT